MMRTSMQGRALAIVATVIVHALIAAGLLISWSVTRPVSPGENLSVFSIPAAAPQAEDTPAQEPPPLPKAAPVEAPAIETPPAIAAAPVTPAPIPRIAAPPARIAPPPVAPPAPRRDPAPAPAPSPPPAGPVDPSWEGKVLKHIDRHKRYPRMIGSRRPVGTAIVLFRMNRQGAILSARIERTSGNAQLDKAAIETVRRSAPLPAIPSDRPDPLQLSVPVEFERR